MENFTISIKIRILPEMSKTMELVRRAEKMGVSYVAVHGRTPKQRNEPVDYQAIKTIKEALDIPVIANGDIFYLEDVEKVYKETNVNGVMSARGLLRNPGMFTGQTQTSSDCIKDFIDLSLNHGLPFSIFHHHLIDMTENLMSREDRKLFNCINSVPGVLSFLKTYEIMH